MVIYVDDSYQKEDNEDNMKDYILVVVDEIKVIQNLIKNSIQKMDNQVDNLQDDNLVFIDYVDAVDNEDNVDLEVPYQVYEDYKVQEVNYLIQDDDQDYYLIKDYEIDCDQVDIELLIGYVDDDYSYYVEVEVEKNLKNLNDFQVDSISYDSNYLKTIVVIFIFIYKVKLQDNFHNNFYYMEVIDHVLIS